MALADDGGLTMTGRAGYAKLIREVHIYWPSPLWRALGRAGDLESHNAAGGDNAHDGNDDELDLPRLEVLRMAHTLSRLIADGIQTWRASDQVPLEKLISARLVELSCALTASALISLREMLENTSPRQVLRLRMLELHGHGENTAADHLATGRIFGLLA
jgi:hypothetical protein